MDRRHRTPRNLWRPFPLVARIWENFDSTQRVTVLRRKEQKKTTARTWQAPEMPPSVHFFVATLL